MKHKRIIFDSREKVGVFLFELQMWGVRESDYRVFSDYSVAAFDSNVIDVATETFKEKDYRIVDWHGGTRRASAVSGHNNATPE